MTFQRIITFLLFYVHLIISFESCSFYHGKLSKKERNNIIKIALYSDLGPKLNYDYAGSMSYKNKHQEIQSPWDMDQIIGNALLEALKVNPKYEKIELVGGELNKHPYFDQMIFAKRNGEKIKPYLEKLETLGFDTFIIVQTWRQLEDSSLTPGYGFHYDNRILVHDLNFYLTAKIRIYDVKIKKEISATDIWENPYIDLKDFQKKKTFQEWLPTDLEKVKMIVQEHTNKNVKRVLANYGL